MMDIKVRRNFCISFYSGITYLKLFFSYLSIPNNRPPVGRLRNPLQSVSRARQLWMVNNKL